MSGAPVAARRALAGVLERYHRFVSPFLPRACRFHPTCAEYTAAAVARHGILRGGWLSLCRLGRCQPWHPGGVDPVP